MKNVIEGALRSVYKRLLERSSDYCSCPRCQDDVITFALNNTRPRYVSGNPPLGEVVTGVQLSYDQATAELTVLLLDAMKRVAANPRHGDAAAATARMQGKP
ncbi:MAG: late competence development ComFB family protein [Gemmatimonadaceae bacterium]